MKINPVDEALVRFSVAGDGDLRFYPLRSVMNKWGFNRDQRKIRFGYQSAYYLGNANTKEYGMRFWEVEYLRDTRSRVVVLQKHKGRSYKLEVQGEVKCKKLDVIFTKMWLMQDGSFIVQYPSTLEIRPGPFTGPKLVPQWANNPAAGNMSTVDDRKYEIYFLARQAGYSEQEAKERAEKLAAGLIPED